MPSDNEKKYGLSLFLFRRDLRLHDNKSLIEACKSSTKVIPAFILDGNLLDPSGEKYRPNLIQFMIESLRELHQAFRSRGSELYLFYAVDIQKKLNSLIISTGAEALFLNEDYTPFSRNRDSGFKNSCGEMGVDFNSGFDLLLTRPGDVLNSEEEPYKVYSWFFRTARALQVTKPQRNDYRNFYNKSIKNSIGLNKLDEFLHHHNDSLAQRGGRENALKRLKDISRFSDYNEKRDIPSVDGTTRLSAHIKFGTVSPREVYWIIKNNLGNDNRLINELYWRDFFAHLGYFYPHIFSGAFNRKYGDIYWENDTEKFDKWCSGKTGFPIVDAGMRQLNETGWMHNRLRMIVASFLTKDLHIDWKWGERYFAGKLVDYDPCSNNGGWQWAASTGADSQPYFRIFNPWLQQKRYDPDALFIKEYVRELEDLEPEKIHNLFKTGSEKPASYPEPIVDHNAESEKAKVYYNSLK